MTVIVPCDYNQTKAATIAIAEYRPGLPAFRQTDMANFYCT